VERSNEGRYTKESGEIMDTGKRGVIMGRWRKACHKTTYHHQRMVMITLK
jgi:hypothetical protein